MFEPDWEGSIAEGDQRHSVPGFVFVVGLKGLDREQTTQVRDQAAVALARYESSERAVVVGAFRAIVRAATERLDRRPFIGDGFPVAGPNWYQVTVAADLTDPLSHLYDDAGTVIAVALANADDPDEAIATVWRRIADGFARLELSARISRS